MSRSLIFALISETLDVMALSTSDLQLDVHAQDPITQQFFWYNIRRDPGTSTFDLYEDDNIHIAHGWAMHIVDQLRALIHRNVQIDAVTLTGPFQPPSDDPPILLLYGSFLPCLVPLARTRRSHDASGTFDL